MNCHPLERIQTSLNVVQPSITIGSVIVTQGNARETRLASHFIKGDISNTNCLMSLRWFDIVPLYIKHATAVFQIPEVWD